MVSPYSWIRACPHSTCSSSVVTLARPPTSSSLKITDRSFRYASFGLWNKLPSSLRQPHSGTSSSSSNSPTPSTFIYHFFLFCFTTLLIYNSPSFTHGLKPTFFTNTPPPRSFTSSLILPS